MNTRSVKLAKTWKKKQIDELIKQKNEMVEYNIDNKLIEDYINKERDRINKEYKERVEKHQTSNNEKKKKLEIELLIKNKNILEKNGLSNKEINEYVEKEMNYINQKYALQKIDFID